MTLLLASSTAASPGPEGPAYGADPPQPAYADEMMERREKSTPLGESAGTELRTQSDATSEGWHYEGFYVTTGVAPGTTFHLQGINPMLRYDIELGMHWKRKKWEASFGAEAWLLQYYERKRVGGGLHGVITISRRPVYVRFGAGSLTGIPGSPDDADVRPAVGGLVGLGLQGGNENVTGRFGFDYHVSIDKAGRVNNTVLLAMRLKF